MTSSALTQYYTKMLVLLLNIGNYDKQIKNGSLKGSTKSRGLKGVKGSQECERLDERSSVRLDANWVRHCRVRGRATLCSAPHGHQQNFL